MSSSDEELNLVPAQMSLGAASAVTVAVAPAALTAARPEIAVRGRVETPNGAVAAIDATLVVSDSAGVAHHVSVASGFFDANLPLALGSFRVTQLHDGPFNQPITLAEYPELHPDRAAESVLTLAATGAGNLSVIDAETYEELSGVSVFEAIVDSGMTMSALPSLSWSQLPDSCLHAGPILDAVSSPFTIELAQHAAFWVCRKGYCPVRWKPTADHIGLATLALTPAVVLELAVDWIDCAADKIVIRARRISPGCEEQWLQYTTLTPTDYECVLGELPAGAKLLVQVLDASRGKRVLLEEEVTLQSRHKNRLELHPSTRESVVQLEFQVAGEAPFSGFNLRGLDRRARSKGGARVEAFGLSTMDMLGTDRGARTFQSELRLTPGYYRIEAIPSGLVAQVEIPGDGRDVSIHLDVAGDIGYSLEFVNALDGGPVHVTSVNTVVRGSSVRSEGRTMVGDGTPRELQVQGGHVSFRSPRGLLTVMIDVDDFGGSLHTIEASDTDQDAVMRVIRLDPVAHVEISVDPLLSVDFAWCHQLRVRSESGELLEPYGWSVTRSRSRVESMEFYLRGEGQVTLEYPSVYDGRKLADVSFTARLGDTVQAILR